jgi:hypothetical protein
MQIHLDVEREVQQIGEPAGDGQVIGARGRQGQDPGVLDQEEIILPHVVLKPVLRERPVAESADEGVRRDPLADRGGCLVASREDAHESHHARIARA